jgi:hypothetical protein
MDWFGARVSPWNDAASGVDRAITQRRAREGPRTAWTVASRAATAAAVK